MGVQIPPSAPDLKKASFAGLFRTTREVLAPRLSELSGLSPETDLHVDYTAISRSVTVVIDTRNVAGYEITWSRPDARLENRSEGLTVSPPWRAARSIRCPRIAGSSWKP
jgi:hypothetical protein